MQAIVLLALLVFLGGLSGSVLAADKALTGLFEGTGRACADTLYVRAKTIEWNSTYSLCKRTRYEVLENKSEGGRERSVFRLKSRSSRCRYWLVEVEHAGGYNWNVVGYQSLEGFQKRGLSDWSNSPLPERQTLSCLMTGLD